MEFPKKILSCTIIVSVSYICPEKDRVGGFVKNRLLQKTSTKSIFGPITMIHESVVFIFTAGTVY